MADSDQSGNSALASIYGALLAAQTSMYNANVSAQTNLAMNERQVAAQMYGNELAARTSIANAQLAAETSNRNAELGYEASKYGAGSSYAAAQYAADLALLNNREQRSWNADHPDNLYRIATSNPVQNVIQRGQSWISGLLKGSPSAKSKSSH